MSDFKVLPSPIQKRPFYWRFCINTSGRICSGGKSTISPYDIDKLMVDQKWKCAVSGIPLEPPVRGGKGRTNPFGPSIDRIVPELGYVPGNVRIVCNIVNFAMNEWGEDALHELVRRMSVSTHRH